MSFQVPLAKSWDDKITFSPISESKVQECLILSDSQKIMWLFFNKNIYTYKEGPWDEIRTKFLGVKIYISSINHFWKFPIFSNFLAIFCNFS